MTHIKADQVRVRFAPAPTGIPHIGNLRTAIFNWLYARHNNGKFLIRIEDTDRERVKQEYVDAINQTLQWMDMESDEQPIIQSERFNEHKQLFERLVDEKKAYRCYCTDQEIVARHKQKMGRDDLYVTYDGYCRNRERTGADEQKPFVIRFALPQDLTIIEFDDLIRGRLSLSAVELDDFIFVRSDGTPMYNFVVVADDAYMRITHILRGEDHILNTFKQILLYQACNFPVPHFGHLSMILGPSGEKLSKRDAATSVLDYRREGYLPDALFNYLVRLGWAHGDQEVFSREELISLFTLEHVGKKGAIFDIQKLAWLNGVYIREQQEQALLQRIKGDVEPTIVQQLAPWSEATMVTAIRLYKERVKTLRELCDELTLLHDGPTAYAAHDIATWVTSETPAHLDLLIQKLDALKDFDVELVTTTIKELAKEKGLKLVALAQPIRLGLVGKSASPGVFELLTFLGKDASLKRLRAVRTSIEKNS